MSDVFAVDATRRILASLPTAFADGGERAARESMAVAAYEAGLAISNASVTLVHGMSRPIGAHFHVPHGLSNAMLLAPCLTFAAEGAPARFAALARAVGAAPPQAGDGEAAAALIAALQAITKRLHIPSPAAYGIPEAEYRGAIEQMAREALQSGSPGNTLRSVAEADIITLYNQVYA